MMKPGTGRHTTAASTTPESSGVPAEADDEPIERAEQIPGPPSGRLMPKLGGWLTEEALDYPDCGNPDRETGIAVPREIAEEIARRKAIAGPR